MKINTTYKIKSLPLIMAVAMALIGCSSLAMIGHTSAASLTQTMVRLDRLKFSTLTSGRVCAKSANGATVGQVVVTFPTNSGTDYSLAAVGSWTVTTTNLDAGQTAWPGITNATSVSGKAVTFTSGVMTNGTLYCFNFAAALTTASTNTETATGTVQTQTSGAVAIDTGNFSEGLSALGDDSIAITNAVVPPSFSFTLSANTDSFTTNLSTGSIVSTNGRIITVSTNAANGYILWAKDANNSGSKGALFSSTANFYLVGSAAVGTAVRTMTTGTQDYGMGAIKTANPSGGTLTMNTNYDSTGFTTKVGTLDPVKYEQIASSNGTASNDQVTVTERATVSGQTAAASDYGDVITVVGAGLF